jgi:hypothetical protein
MIDWIESGKGRTKTDYVSVLVTASSSKKEGYLQLGILLSDSAQKDLRIIEGDRVLVGIDRVSKQICIKRVTGILASIKVSRSSTKTLRIQCKSPLPKHSSIAVKKEHVHIEATHIAIDVPELFKDAT